MVSEYDEVVIWEKGIVRIADLAILPPTKYNIWLEPNGDHSKVSGVTSVQLFDEWDYFTIKFGVLYPSQSFTQDQRVLRINGGRSELGGWLSGTGPLMMK